jgi:hypothetical protein
MERLHHTRAPHLGRKLLIASVIATLGIIATAGVAVVSLPSGSTVSRHGRDLRYQKDAEAATRLALLAIVADLRRHPEATAYQVRWNESPLVILGLDEEFDRHWLIYHHSEQKLTLSDYGGSGVWGNVREEYLSEAADRGSLVEVLKGHHCPSFP